MKESKLVTFIGGFYIFGGVVIFMSLIFGGDPINTVFGLPNTPDWIVKLLIAALFIPGGYLYVQRLVLGYWFILVSSIVFFCISATLTTQYGTQPYIGNMLYAFFVAIITIMRKPEFKSSLSSLKKGRVKKHEV
jgi:hypothetical protein